MLLILTGCELVGGCGGGGGSGGGVVGCFVCMLENYSGRKTKT
jgi:hypothetical protein